MASVTLTRAYLNLASDQTQMLVLSTSAKTENPFINGSVNQYAAGRFRVVTQAGISDNDDLTFTLVAKDDRDTLRSWIGQVVCYRDPHGTKHWGTYLTYKSTEQVGANYADVELGSFLTVTYTDLT